MLLVENMHKYQDLCVGSMPSMMLQSDQSTEQLTGNVGSEAFIVDPPVASIPVNKVRGCSLWGQSMVLHKLGLNWQVLCISEWKLLAHVNNQTKMVGQQSTFLW